MYIGTHTQRETQTPEYILCCMCVYVNTLELWTHKGILCDEMWDDSFLKLYI